MSSRGTFRGTSPPPPAPSTILNHASAILHIPLLLLLLPLFVYGAIMNILPAFVANRVSRKASDPHLVVSVRFGAGFILFTLWYILLSILAVVMLPSLWMSIPVILSLPISGIIAFYYFHYARYIFRLN
jgi:hypothetical protein